jgi:hypothetical protein
MTYSYRSRVVVVVAAVASVAAVCGSVAPLVAQTAEHSTGGASAPRIELASPSIDAPFRAGNRYFDVNDSGVFEVRDGENGTPRPLLPAGTFELIAPSPNGRYIAYAVGPDPKPPYDVRIRDVQTGQDLPDVLHHARISPAPWSHDNKGFLYVRDDSTDGRQRVYYHGLGHKQASDGVILSQANHPDWRYNARVSDDGHYAVFTISYPADDHTRIYFIDLADAEKPNFNAPIVKLTQSFDARYEFVDNAGSYFFLQTDRAAPRGRILLANTDVIREARWPSLIPETDDTLLFARTAGDEYLVAVYRTAAGATIAKMFGPEDPAVRRHEMKVLYDSLKNAKPKRNDRRQDRGAGMAFARNGPAIRLSPMSDIPIPAGATIVAMNSVADQEQLFYTLKLSDGTTQSFIYNVKKSDNKPFDSSSSTR